MKFSENFGRGTRKGWLYFGYLNLDVSRGTFLKDMLTLQDRAVLHIFDSNSLNSVENTLLEICVLRAPVCLGHKICIHTKQSMLYINNPD